MALQGEIENVDDPFGLDGAIASESPMVDVSPRTLTRQQKAAIIVRLLLGQGVSSGVSKLPPHQQLTLAHIISELGNIDRTTLAGVVQEFAFQIDNLALCFPVGLSETVELLEPHLAPAILKKLRISAEQKKTKDPWAHISRQSVECLRPLMDSESAEVCAVLLSKLNVAKASELLAGVSPDRSEMLAHTMALTETITSDLVERIGMHITALLDDIPETAFDQAAAERVGEILNATPQDARDRVLEGLANRDQPFAKEVKKSIFSFTHLPTRLDPPDVPLVMRRIESETAKTAMAAGLAAAPLTVEFLLENMSKRLAEQMRDEAETMGAPKGDAGEAAMAQIVSTIKELEAAGEIILLPPLD